MKKTNFKTIISHTTVWLLTWVIMSFWASKGNQFDEYLLKNVSVLIPTIAIVYINWFFLFPKYFKTKRYILYSFLSLLSLYLVFYLGEMLIIEWMNLLFPDRPIKEFEFNVYALPTSFWRIMNGAAPYTLGLLSSTIFLAIDEKNQGEKEKAALKLENAQNKIKYLQSQISPHFLFNSLNNVHSLILQDKDLASDYILQLSDLLRFMIYETDKELITLEEEINLITKYMALVDFRIGSSDVSSSLDINVERPDLKIPPLLIFGILENGIKHSGMGIEREFFFKMEIVEKKHILKIEMTNSISSQKFDKKKKGFGIESLKKRLEMYYPNDYTFDFHKREDMATTHLTLKLRPCD